MTQLSPGGVALPKTIIVPCRGQNLDELLTREWLLANRLGTYASSTVVGCNARRYHGLLVASTLPPVGRIATLSDVMEQVAVDTPDASTPQMYNLATNEFPGAFSPRGVDYLEEFRNGVTPTWVFRFGGVELVKEIVLAPAANTVALRYTVKGGPISMKLWPFAVMRGFHGLRNVSQPHQMIFESVTNGAAVRDLMQSIPPLYLISREAGFQADAQWWYQFRYRIDIDRGQDGLEDSYTPGYFLCHLNDGESCQLTASIDSSDVLDFDAAIDHRRQRMVELAASVGPNADTSLRRLAIATDAFVVQRHFPNRPPSETILAGYHWFADWGRDTFIALPGLLLETKRFEQARNVFSTFASAISEGMVPNCFDDYSSSAHYNSIDASLWFIIAADRYMDATNDQEFWQSTLMPAINKILTAYQNGTRFDIHADADGLLLGGSRGTQLTWMDAAFNGEPVTPRQGKAVEINALWLSAHRIMAQRCAGLNAALADRYRTQAAIIAPAFVNAFWNEQFQWLNDCVNENGADASLRPNQIFAVALPHSALSKPQQKAVVDAVTRQLLTPYGLRTLSPLDSRYCGHYGHTWESRDRAYHQGTVWAWLMGPFIEAYLKVNDNNPKAVSQARCWLASFDEHLEQAGLGSISEIFEGDEPYTPVGCIAQAWSVGEVLRARQLVARAGKSR